MKRQAPFNKLICYAGLFLWLLSPNAWSIDWQTVTSSKLTLFYPGQASWEWLLTDHRGAGAIKAGQSCAQCHDGNQTEMGQALASGKLLEPEPISGKAGAVDVNVQTAHDQHNLYIRMQWAAAKTTAPKLSADFEAMAAIMLDDGQVAEVKRAGCWGACHDDATGMASAEAVKGINKYLVKSRSKMTRQGGGEHIKPDAELQPLFAAGFFVELWQAQLNRGQTPQVADAYILETRHDHNPARVAVNAKFNNGTWAVEFSRPLTMNIPGYKNIEPGKTYTIGLAVHDGFVNGRRHYVSFGHSLRLDEGQADFIAAKQ